MRKTLSRKKIWVTEKKNWLRYQYLNWFWFPIPKPGFSRTLPVDSLFDKQAIQYLVAIVGHKENKF